MPLQLPSLGDPSYRAILDEALARIPVHNPEWTNFNESDPGVTLLQLFAFMTENLLYRANLIPERNRLKFLELLGIPIREAAAARGFVTFRNVRSPLKTRTIKADIELLAGQVPFRTENGLDVLPIEAKIYYKKASQSVDDPDTRRLYEQLYASLDEESETSGLAFYETAEQESASDTVTPTIHLSADTVDNYLWLALLAPTAAVVGQAKREIANKILSLGIIPVPDPATATLYPGGTPPDEESATLLFDRPDLQHATDGSILPSAKYTRLENSPLGGVNPLLEPGVVELEMPDEGDIGTWTDLDPLEPGTGNFPPFIEDDEIDARVITWVRIGISNAEKVGPNGGRLHIVGINAATVTQRARVSNEFIGLGNGQPDQRFQLVNTPVITDKVQLTVNGELWSPIDDFLNAGAEVRRESKRSDLPTSTKEDSEDELQIDVYTVDRESGEIRFGDGLHGRRPRPGAVIQASYDYGGGLQGLLGVGAISKSTSLPAGLETTNPLRTWGGAEAESVTEAEKNIPAYLRHRDRLVSVRDFEEITLRTPGVDVGRVEVLPLYDPDTLGTNGDGLVTVMVIPEYDLVYPNTPQPDHLFLERVCKYLHPRRLITTELHIRGPEYVSVWVSIGIDVVAGEPFAPVREDVKSIVTQFLSSLKGGFELEGWPLSRPVEAAELLAVAARVSGVSKVNEVLLGTASGSGKQTISLSGLQLPRLAGIEVQSGSAQSLDELRGDLDESVPETALTPVPVIPDDC